MGFFILGDENIKWWGDAIVLLLAFTPPVVGAVLGVRSALSGNRFGAHAAAVAGAWIGFWGAFWYLANYPYNSESSVVPAILAGVAAAVACAGVEAWYWLRSRRPAAP